MQTSLIPLESSLHGRERRQLRNIAKRDLQAAIKYGKKTSGYPCRQSGEIRWKYEFADVIYITDASSIKEVTSYIKPINLTLLPLDKDEKVKFEIHQKLAQVNPDICTSHTVLVIDQSASMRTHDVENFKSRSDAVYGHLALEFITMQLENGASYTDVVSIIEMHDDAEIVMHRGPISKYLYNQIVDLQKNANPCSHGNYMPCIAKIENLLARDSENSQCACVVLFLSDGQPSDSSTRRFYGTSFDQELSYRLESLARSFGGQLTFGCIGFTNGSVELSYLKSMAASVVKGGSKGIYFHSQLDSASLIQSLTHLSHSLLQSKMRMTVLAQSVAKTAKKIKWDYANFDGENSDIFEEGWIRYLDKAELWEYVPRSNPTDDDWIPRASLHKDAIGFAKRERIFGQGAERTVYELREIAIVKKELAFVGERLVAKDNRFHNPNPSAKSNLKFHTLFAKTQLKASLITDEFNSIIANLVERKVRVVFLKCFCYVYGEDGYLVERLIDKDRYRKWNDNKGTVRLNSGFEELHLNSQSDYFDDSEFLQALSHWSYRNSNRKNLLCDLQGVLTKNSKEILFELTDPVIHHDYKTGQGKNYGLTDHGKAGITNFFKSHTCGPTCENLGLHLET